MNPATEEVIGQVADATREDMDRAIAAARRAFDTTEWSHDLTQRATCLRQLHAALVTTNHPARRLYRSLGFSTYGLEPRGLACAGQYFDQELMVLRLDRER